MVLLSHDYDESFSSIFADYAWYFESNIWGVAKTTTAVLYIQIWCAIHVTHLLHLQHFRKQSVMHLINLMQVDRRPQNNKTIKMEKMTFGQ